MNNKKIQLKNSTKISVKNLDLQTHIRKFLIAMGENPDRGGLIDTPKRFEKTVKYLLSGYDRSFEEEKSIFENDVKYKDIIFLKNIDFFSLCEHHFLPFFGFVHIGYIPSKDGYLGISKLARAVDIFSKRLQNQEILSFQIAEALMQHGKAKGVAILIEARHLCNVARGVQKRAAVMTTCAYYGEFEKNNKAQQQFLELIRDREKV
jgi:GTP cyclohydrolase I